MPNLLPGTEVLARGLRWEVVSIQPSGDQQIHRLRCVEGSLRGIEYDLLVPFEPIEPILQEINPAKAGRLAQWRVYHRAFLLEQALGPDALLAAQPGRLRVAPYQLVPVMRALELGRPRLLLADGVGLGKTVEAGLILAELIARRRAHRILIVSPAGPLLHQWRSEMRERFGLRFSVLDADRLQEIRYQTELGSNPFDHQALGLISIDFVKQERVLQDLERSHYDVVVIDEAHHCAALGPAGDLEDSQRRRAAQVLARQADGLLLLTATPHDGYDPHFASLVELLDPSLVDGRGALRGDRYRRHVIRRLKRHIREESGKPLFPERRVTPVRVLFSAATHPLYSQLQAALLALVAPHLKRALRQRQFGDVLAFIALLKRSVSTVAACRATLNAIAQRLDDVQLRNAAADEARAQRLRTLRDYRRRLERSGALSPEEEEDQAALEAEDIAAQLRSSGAPELMALLAEETAADRKVRRARRRAKDLREALLDLEALAADAEAEDPKLFALADCLRQIRIAEPDANVLVYTEYADSQDAAEGHLRAALAAGDLAGEVLCISGADPDTDRLRVTERFRRGDRLILLSTDAMAEGLNLHERCHHLVHLELPYNPNRLEQRNGRIDRFGQTAEPCVSYLYLSGTFEERLLLRLISKYERQRKALSFVPNTLGIWSADAGPAVESLLSGMSEESGQLFVEAPRLELAGEEVESPESQPYRELLQEIDRAFSGFEKAARTHQWLGGGGMAAEDVLLDRASEARARSAALGMTELFEFVADALRSDCADDPVRTVSPALEIYELALPPAWTHGLDDLPGYDPQKRTLLLTTDPNVVLDPENRPVGYAGRAHPIVRRALDRVRNVQFGIGGSGLDRRAAAAASDVAAPELLVTFVGRVESAAGRELERVIGVRVPRGTSPVALPEITAWWPLAGAKRAIPSAGLWEEHFASWAGPRIHEAEDAAREAFEPLATEAIEQHQGRLAADSADLEAWLRGRASDICGQRTAAQPSLFETPSERTRPRWETLLLPADRLAAFATDGAEPLRQRREAEGVLALYDRRRKELDRRTQLGAPRISLVGMLMLIPRGAA